METSTLLADQRNLLLAAVSKHLSDGEKLPPQDAIAIIEASAQLQENMRREIEELERKLNGDPS